MDARSRYRRLNDEVFALYVAARQRDALRLIADRPDALAPWSAELAHLAACLHGSLGEHQAALDVLRDAASDGAWWDPGVLYEDGDLCGVRELSEFGTLVESSRSRWREHTAADDRSGDLLAEPRDPARAVLVALHGSEQDADDAIAAWQPALRCGLAVYAVQSSQRASPRYRHWRDPERAAGELASVRETLPEHLRALPVVAAGFSAGGRIALRWAVGGAPHAVSGVIAVAPAIAPQDLPAADARPLSPARILIGSEDDLLDGVAQVADRLREEGVSIEVVPALGHDLPADFPDRLTMLLNAFV